MEGVVAWFMQNSWLYVGSLAGSLLAMLTARGLNLAGRLQTLAVGTISGCIFGPVACEWWFSDYDPQTSRVPAFVCAFIGMVALGVIPILIKKSKEFATDYEFKGFVRKQDE